MNCSNTCLAYNDGSRPCDGVSGDCQLGCEDTWYGGHCQLSCSDDCIDMLCERNGSCTSGCKDGKYGPMCQYNCIATCNDGRCDRISGRCAECEKPREEQSPLCRTAGKYYGMQLASVVH